MSVYLESELAGLGLASIGVGVLISKKASFYGGARISIGNNTRIDDFCVLSAGDGGICLGDYVHVSVMCSLIGRGRIVVGDFSALSGRVSVYSSSDDYSGRAMANPMVPADFTNVDSRPVRVGRHVIVGCGSVVLPGSDIGEGVAVGALSLVKGSLEEFHIYGGVPARVLGPRMRDCLIHGARLKPDERV